MNDRNKEHQRYDISYVPRSIWKPGKEEAVTKNEMVTAMQPLSAEVGLEDRNLTSFRHITDSDINI